jgi:hypothetical protein
MPVAGCISSPVETLSFLQSPPFPSLWEKPTQFTRFEPVWWSPRGLAVASRAYIEQQRRRQHGAAHHHGGPQRCPEPDGPDDRAASYLPQPVVSPRVEMHVPLISLSA